MTGLYVAAAALVVASALGLLWRRRNGFTSTADRTRLGPSDLGADLGEKATLVQFSSAFCAPCRATRRILADVAGTLDGVTHIEIDAESHLDLVRRLNILRTPTVLILDPSGTVVRRSSGPTRKPDLLAALADTVVAPLWTSGRVLCDRSVGVLRQVGVDVRVTAGEMGVLRGARRRLPSCSCVPGWSC